MRLSQRRATRPSGHSCGVSMSIARQKRLARWRHGAAEPLPPSAKPDAMPPCGMRMRPGNVRARGTTLQQLTRNLSQFVGRAVVDRTGLDGAFDIDLQWSPEQTADASGPSIFTAVQEQLGLKLDSQRAANSMRRAGHRSRRAPGAGLGWNFLAPVDTIIWMSRRALQVRRVGSRVRLERLRKLSY